jgi:hypothetical protein
LAQTPAIRLRLQGAQNDVAWHVTFSPDGKIVAACFLRGPAKAWSAESGVELTWLKLGKSPQI